MYLENKSSTLDEDSVSFNLRFVFNAGLNLSLTSFVQLRLTGAWIVVARKILRLSRPA